MNTPSSTPGCDVRRRTYQLVIGLFVLAITVLSIPPIFNNWRGRDCMDYPLWYRTGQRVLQGGDIYHQSEVEGHVALEFIYPPTAAFLLGPISALGKFPLIVFLDLLNSGAWVASVLLGVYLVTGKALRQHPLLYLVPSAACVLPINDMYLLGQPHLLLLACLLGAFAFLRTKHHWATGALIALAAAIKAFPVLAVGYLVYRRQWKATLFTLAFLLFFLVVLPAPFRGFERNLGDLATWAKSMLRFDVGPIAQRPQRAYSWKNQSLVALANRLLRHVDADLYDRQPLFVNVADLEGRYINAGVLAAALGICLLFVISMPRPGQRTARSDAVEYAMVLLLILMFSPVSYDYFFVWLLYPLAVALHVVLTAPTPSPQRALTLFWFCACVFLLALPLLPPWSEKIPAWGNCFWASFLLLGGLGWKLKAYRQTHPRQPVHEQARAA